MSQAIQTRTVYSLEEFKKLPERALVMVRELDWDLTELAVYLHTVQREHQRRSIFIYQSPENRNNLRETWAVPEILKFRGVIRLPEHTADLSGMMDIFPSDKDLHGEYMKLLREKGAIK